MEQIPPKIEGRICYHTKYVSANREIDTKINSASERESCKKVKINHLY